MFKKLSEIWNNWSVNGVKLPYALDHDRKGPSLTLLIYYVSSILVLGSLVAYHINPSVGLLGANFNAIIIWVISYVMYRMRRIDKFKFDLDDKEFELDSGDSESEKEDKNDNA
jgi:amino acid permease